MRNENNTNGLNALLAAILCGALIISPAHAKPAKAPKAATVEVDESEAEEADPIEPFNRGVYYFNYAVDAAVIRPVTLAYRYVMPPQGRTMVSNALNNLYSPATFVNSVLQGDAENSFITLWRFLINSTVGLAGLFDPASDIGLQGRTTDLGQTFAIYGADAGPYLVLPIIGPSNVRDAFGRLGDMFASPVTYTDDDVFYPVLGVTAIDARSRYWQFMNDTYDTSLDPYATFRSGFMQHRAEAVKKAKQQRKASIDKAAAAK